MSLDGFLLSLALPCSEVEGYVFTRHRRALAWTQRAGTCARVKRAYRRRLRHYTRLVLREVVW